MIVLSDEAALPWGMLRIRERGSAGGHNGLKSVIAAIGSNEFIRVRLGVEPEYPLGDMAEYVLGTMRKPEREIAAQMVVDAAEAVELIVAEGVGKAMAKFNRSVEADGRKFGVKVLISGLGSSEREDEESRSIWKSVSTT